MKSHCILILLLFISFGLKGQSTKKQKEVLLIGLFHFNNPGADLAKTDKFDVMTGQSQQELEFISNKIKEFRPDKIFVEWEFHDQIRLDSLYGLYLNDKYFEFVEKNYPKSSFYKENEIFQLGFRIAKKSGLDQIYGMDVAGKFPFDSLLLGLDEANQQELKQEIFDRIQSMEAKDNEDRKKYTLTELILNKNKKESRDSSLGSYISLFNPGGEVDDFSGADLVAHWYRRNLRMYSLIQKLTEENDDRIVVIAGSGHIAVFQHFIELDENYRIVELEDLLMKK